MPPVSIFLHDASARSGAHRFCCHCALNLHAGTALVRAVCAAAAYGNLARCVRVSM